jgi:hypothetical protein
MSSFKTYSQELSATINPVRSKDAEMQSSSFAASIKSAAQRFVTWIDGVDVDGQEHWTR